MSQIRLPTIIALPLSQKDLKLIIDKAKDWALMHGVGMRPKKSFNKDTIQFAPFVLIPSPFPRDEFYKAVDLQPILNELLHKVAHDYEFLSETLANTLQVDEFTASLYNIWDTVRKEGIAQPLSLGMLRSDIMLETRCPHKGGNCPQRYRSPYCCWKQIEINSIASGFGHLGPISRSIQSYILTQLGHADKIKNLPRNDALQGLCGGITTAWDMYGIPNATVLFLVEDVTYNICDQRFHEFEICERRPEINVIRKTLTDVYNEGELNDKKQLIIDNKPVAVVYFRSGYEPGHYPTSNEWDAHLLIERSNAIKCPSIQYHLAGTKKVQQELAKPGVLEQFIDNPAKVQKVRDIFTGLYSLDFDDVGEEAVKMAIQDAERFVLKPQREGGGNNLYGSEVREALVRMRGTRERSAYILMERITPPVVSGYMVRPSSNPAPQHDEIPPLMDLVSELGIFGVIIGTADNIMVNKQVGHMLRTKLSDVDEGGVAAGYGALDSPYLIDM